MDSVFFLNEEDRARLIRNIAQSVGCSYCCLWAYYPHPSNCLMSMDGWYNEETSQPISSSGSLSQRFFEDYRLALYNVDNGHVPGLAFKEGLSYIQLNESELLSRASSATQRRFYQEARIKTAAFMGCKSGEIEIGTSTDPTEINMEMEMRKFFPAELHQLPHFRELPHQHDQSHPSSSSSSLRSLSVNSPEYSSILFNMPSTSSMPGETLKEVPIDQKAIKSISTGILPHQQTGQAFPWLRSIQHPTPESDDAAMTRAMLAVISSPSSSSSYQSQQQQQPPPYNYKVMNQRWSAFKRYRQSALQPNVLRRDNLGRKNMLKRAIAFLKSLELKRVQEQMQGIRTTSNQLHHMISERKRREKLNESFHALRSLLPPGFKKDKASVLSSTREYLNALKAQVLELQQKNQLLEARLSPEKEVSEEGNTVTGSPGRRVDIRVTHAAESASEEREIDLQVTVLQDCDLLELSIRLLESLKQITDVSLVSMEAHTQMQQTGSYNRVTLRLNIKGSEWDESAFREAIDKVVADVAP